MTISPRSAFIAQFNAKYFPFVINSVHAVSELDVDVCLLTARKAACLYDAMSELGMVTLPGRVVTDRVLDMETDWLSGQRVALIDDVVISGSTLYRTAKVVHQASGKEPQIHAIAVDIKWWVPELAQPTQPYLQLDDRSALNLCSQIIDAISVVPRPYNVDWPLYDGVSLPTPAAHVLNSLGRWETFDTTTTTQHRAGVLSLTHETYPAARIALEHRLGLDLSAARLLKVRLCGRYTPGTGDRLDLRVLPIVAFEGLPTATVDQLFSAITEQVGDSNGLAAFTSVKSRLRLIQFVISARLGRLWLEDLLSVCDVRNAHQFSTTQLGFAFPPTTTDAVRRLAESDNRLDVHAKLPPISRVSYAAPAGPFRRPDAWNLQARLSEPFQELFDKKEIPARRFILKHGTAAFGFPRMVNLLNRLNLGYSLAELEELISKVGGDELDAGRLVSAYLDIAIDHGVAVPTTYVDKRGVVVRAYRHGEDIEFASNEQRLFGLMLNEAINAFGGSLPYKTAEKLCVLFLQISLNAGHLNRWSGRLGEGGSVGVRYSRHGAVVATASKSFFEYVPNNGLIAVLKDAGTLKKDGPTKLKIGRIHASAPTSPEADALAEKVGIMFGQLLREDTNPKLTHTDLTLLTSCAAEHQIISALATDISTITHHWQFVSEQQFRGIDDRAIAGQIAEQLRNSALKKAARSGAWKYREHRNHTARRVIERVATGLIDPLYKREWRQYWDLSSRTSEHVATTELELVNQQGRCLLAVYSYLSLAASVLEVLAARDASQSMPRDAERLLRNAVKAANDYDQYTRIHPTELKQFVDRALNLVDATWSVRMELLDQIWSRLDKVILQAGDLIDRTRAIAHPLGHPRSIVDFDSALLVTRAGDSTNVETFDDDVTQLIESQRKTGTRRGYRIDPVPHASTSCNRIVVGADRKSATVFARLAADIARAATGRNLNVRIAIIPQLDDHERLHTGTMSGTYYGTGFDRRVLETVRQSAMRSGPGVHICVLGPPDVATNTVEVVVKRLKTRVGSTSIDTTSPGAWQVCTITTVDQLSPQEMKMNRQEQRKSGPESDSTETISRTIQKSTERRKVFLVHGRDETKAEAMRSFLRSLDLQVVEWSHAKSSLRQGAPYIGDIIIAGMKMAHAVVILLTADEIVQLRPDLEDRASRAAGNENHQSRPNVYYEAGIADALDRDHTVIVEIGDIRPFSDISGRHVVRFDGKPSSRLELRDTLRSVDLAVDDGGRDWLDAGDFD